MIESGQASYVALDGGAPVEGFVFHPTPGHSSGHMSIGLRSGEGYGFFAGDVMHHPVQVYQPDWSLVFSDSPVDGCKSRKWALSHMSDTGALVFSSHFPRSSAGRVTRRADGFEWAFA